MSKPLKHITGGRVVLFEGMDGTGKTTQLQLARQALAGEGWHVESVRAHGGTPIGEALRAVSLSDIPRPVTTDLYLSLAMHAALAKQVNNWRSAGKIILVDRGPLSIAAYQIYGDGLDPSIGWPAVTADLAQFAPELTLVYTTSVTTAIERARRKVGGGSDFFESKGNDYFRRISAGYQAIIGRYGCTAIDSEQASIGEVSYSTVDAIRKVIASADPQA